MESFIDRNADLVFTGNQLRTRLARIERQRYSQRDEEILNRIASGIALGVYQATPDEQQQIADFNTFMAEMVAYGEQVRADNAFVAEKVAYKKALARLERYRLADGRPEVYEDQPTGQFDEEGNEITESVLVQTAIEPLEATIEQPIYDEEGNQTGTETVPNPAIVQDDAERARAQAVIDATSEEIKTFVAEA